MVAETLRINPEVRTEIVFFRHGVHSYPTTSPLQAPSAQKARFVFVSEPLSATASSRSIVTEPRPSPCATRYEEVVRSTAELVSKWQCVGFTHGVLNTDNMSLLGLTIDYGPYGFMDFFDPKFVPNGSDSGGRYSYEKQPEVR